MSDLRPRRSALYMPGSNARALEKAKAVAANTANPFSAAIEAGKDAYGAEKRKNEAKSITEGRASYPVDEKEGK